jgi:CheY-like chemotaxis protein
MAEKNPACPSNGNLVQVPEGSVQSGGGDSDGARNGVGSSRLILVVDDNVDAAECLGELLKVSGHVVHIAHDGERALSAAAQLRPEVIILDIGMPFLNGYQVAQRLRNDLGLTSMLVAVTGYAAESDRIHAQQAGFDHHFAKPLDIHRLSALLGPR